MAEYGPDQFVPVLTVADGSPIGDDDDSEPVPYVREQQVKRLQAAERNLQVLGRVNPLALEEFDAMQERHRFLAEQLDDLRRTRKDLLDIVAEVDQRVEEVFASAYADVAAAFETVFARLFPGGEGRLVLTEPGEWLTTGVDVEARPPVRRSRGCRCCRVVNVRWSRSRSSSACSSPGRARSTSSTRWRRLSTTRTSGGCSTSTRNCGRTSQLLVITHQKRTMEIADALYGVTMRGDGVSTVISQRLHDR